MRARIFERGVGETLSSGTGASGAAVAAVLAGAASPVTVVLDGGELTVEVGDDLDVRLTGWAEPVYSGELSPELLLVADPARALELRQLRAERPGTRRCGPPLTPAAMIERGQPVRARRARVIGDIVRTR